MLGSPVLEGNDEWNNTFISHINSDRKHVTLEYTIVLFIFSLESTLGFNLHLLLSFYDLLKRKI